MRASTGPCEFKRDKNRHVIFANTAPDVVELDVVKTFPKKKLNRQKYVMSSRNILIFVATYM